MPKGAGTFSTALNFMDKHSDYAMFYYYYKITTIRARTLGGLTTSLVRKLYKACRPYVGKISTQVHNVDGSHRGQKLTQVHNVDGPHKGSRSKSPKWTDPTGVKLTQVHNVDGPHKGSRSKSTKWMDPTGVKNLHKSTTWTDPKKGQDLSPKVDGPHKSTIWTDTTNGQNSNP